jgi:hypothetical protein
VDLGRNARVSTEITGYFAGAMTYLASATGDRALLAPAIRAGRFLAGAAWDPALEIFPFELPDGEATPRLAYFFDSGIVIRGLLSLWRATGDAEFRGLAEQAALGMARDFGCEGEPPAILALPAKQPLAPGAGWSRKPGCYQLKSAMAWYELYQGTGVEDFRRWYEASLEAALRSHDGFLLLEADREKVMDRLHAYCYFLEGLLPAVDRPECAAALAEGIERTSRYLGEIAPVFERSDVVAQLLRLRLLAHQYGVVPLDAAAAAQEAASIARFQWDDAPPRLDGGFSFGRKPGQGMAPFANPVSTAFSLQALEMWRQWQTGSATFAWQTLI